MFQMMIWAGGCLRDDGQHLSMHQRPLQILRWLLATAEFLEAAQGNHEKDAGRCRYTQNESCHVDSARCLDGKFQERQVRTWWTRSNDEGVVLQIFRVPDDERVVPQCRRHGGSTGTRSLIVCRRMPKGGHPRPRWRRHWLPSAKRSHWPSPMWSHGTSSSKGSH